MNKELREIQEMLLERGALAPKDKKDYDILNEWDTSKVTDMGYMFNKASSFNQDISNWDVSKVTDMTFIFKYASNFNQDISNWDVSKVTFMTCMFSGAKSFNQDISNWNVSKVTFMTCMFDGASSFNINYSPFPRDYKILKEIKIMNRELNNLQVFIFII